MPVLTAACWQRGACCSESSFVGPPVCRAWYCQAIICLKSPSLTVVPTNEESGCVHWPLRKALQEGCSRRRRTVDGRAWLASENAACFAFNNTAHACSVQDRQSCPVTQQEVVPSPAPLRACLRPIPVTAAALTVTARHDQLIPLPRPTRST